MADSKKPVQLEPASVRYNLHTPFSFSQLLNLPTPNPFQAQQTRDKNRAALATAYDASLLQIEARVQKAVAKHKDLR